MLCIVNYGSGNIAAIVNICVREHIAYKVASTSQELENASHFILPGVGAFDPTIEMLGSSGILAALREQVQGEGKPLLGICVGMHLLASDSDEGNRLGLDWIAGHVTKINTIELKSAPHLPHMGWNEIKGSIDDPLLEGINMDRGFYFLHSYFFDAADASDVVATVLYGAELPCIIRRGNIIGAQFHPEKSHSNGVRFIKNFIGIK